MQIIAPNFSNQLCQNLPRFIQLSITLSLLDCFIGLRYLHASRFCRTDFTARALTLTFLNSLINCSYSKGFPIQKNQFYPITSLEFTLNYSAILDLSAFNRFQTVTILNDLYLGSYSDFLNYLDRCPFILSSVSASKTFSDLKSFLIVLIA